MWGRPALIGFIALVAAPSLGDEIASRPAATEVQPLQIGPWRGGPHNDEATGRFSHCSAGTAFGRVYLSFSMAQDGVWSVDLFDPELRLRAGLWTAMDVSFDRSEPFRLVGIAGAASGVNATLPDSEVALEEFRVASQMHASLLGTRYDFDLASPSQLLSALRDCVAKNSLASETEADQKIAALKQYQQDADWARLRDSADIDALEAFRDAYPNSAHAGEAERRVAALQKSLAAERQKAESDRALNAQQSPSPAPTKEPGPLRTIQSADAPNFVPWPPPMPTALYAYPPDWVRKHRTIGDLSADIEGVLRNSGYTQFSYTTVPGGFALATRFERIDQGEAPMADPTRWAPLAKDVPKSWLDAMKSLFVGRQGRCRLFVFFLTTDDRPPSREEPTVDEATKWSLGGNPTLQPDLVHVSLTPQHIFYVYEYEFVEDSSDDILRAPASALPLDQQLRIVKLLP